MNSTLETIGIILAGMLFLATSAVAQTPAEWAMFGSIPVAAVFAAVRYAQWDNVRTLREYRRRRNLDR